MLNSRTNLKILFGMVAATLVLTVSMPNSGSVNFISAASANEGGGDGSDNMENYFSTQARANRIRAFHRRNAVRAANRAAQRANARATRAARRAARNAVRRAARAARMAARQATRGARFAANPTWASSTDPRTGVTRTSVGQPNGTRQVTVTNANGAVIDSYVSN